MNSSKTIALLETLFFFIFNELYYDILKNIWLPRCEKVLKQEESLKINMKEKKKKFIGPHQNRSKLHSLDHNKFSGQEGINWATRTGGDWLNFTLGVNHLFHF